MIHFINQTYWTVARCCATKTSGLSVKNSPDLPSQTSQVHSRSAGGETRVSRGNGWSATAGTGAYLGAVSWVVNNSGLGFLGGGRKHFTMLGLNGFEGTEMPMATNIKDRRYRWRSQSRRISGDWRCQGAPCVCTAAVRTGRSFQKCKKTITKRYTAGAMTEEEAHVWNKSIDLPPDVGPFYWLQPLILSPDRRSIPARRMRDGQTQSFWVQPQPLTSPKSPHLVDGTEVREQLSPISH